MTEETPPEAPAPVDAAAPAAEAQKPAIPPRVVNKGRGLPPGLPRSSYGFGKHRLNITKDEARARFLAMDNPSCPELHHQLKAEGKNISPHTLRKWATDGMWHVMVAQGKKVTKDYLLDSIEALAKMGSQLKADTFVGLQARMIQRTAAAIDEVQIRNVDDVRGLIEAIRDVRSLHHDFRGEQINQGDRDNVRAIANGSSPVVTLGDFKSKSNGSTNGANGHGKPV